MNTQADSTGKFLDAIMPALSVQCPIDEFALIAAEFYTCIRAEVPNPDAGLSERLHDMVVHARMAAALITDPVDAMEVIQRNLYTTQTDGLGFATDLLAAAGQSLQHLERTGVIEAWHNQPVASSLARRLYNDMKRYRKKSPAVG